MLGNGLHMFDNRPHVIGKSTFFLMSNSGCGIRNFVAFGVMLFGIMSFGIMWHSGLYRLVLCPSALCRIRVMSFGIMLHSSLCRLQTYVIRDCVVCRNVLRVNVVRPTVGVLASTVNIKSIWILLTSLHC